LGLEWLEARQLLTGVVNVEVALAPTVGGVRLVGDADNNSVEIRQGDFPGEYLVTGLDGTLLQLDSAGASVPSLTINNINGDLEVDLGDGDNLFRFLEPLTGGQSLVPADLRITNHAGSNVNILDHLLASGSVFVNKGPGESGYSELQILDSTVVGAVRVLNDAGGGDGPSKTLIDNSHIGGDNATTFYLSNGYGDDVVQIQNGSQFGNGNYPFANVCAIAIYNGDGGSRTSFASDVKVFGCALIENGANLPLQQDIVTFDRVEVVGSVWNCDGGGDSLVSVTNSKIGTQLVSTATTVCGDAVLVPVGGPLAVFNGAGVDQFAMQGSEVPWGLYIDNDASNNDGCHSAWGSTTAIETSKIGTRPLGPGLQGLDPSLPEAALVVNGDNAADSVTVTDTVIGGAADLRGLHDGNNTVSLQNTAMDSLWIAGGAGNDKVTLNSVIIPVQVDVRLDAGADTLRILAGSVLPDLLLGYVVLDGGMGVDSYYQGAAATPARLPAVNFEIVLALANVTPQFPLIAYDSTGVVQYDASSQTFDVTATPLFYKQSAVSPVRAITAPPIPPSLHVQIHVNNLGQLAGGVAGPDLSITGSIDTDGDGNPDLSGTLLTGEILEFAFLEMGVTDRFWFRFAPTGGALQSEFVGKEIVVVTTSVTSSFNDSFTVNFSGGAAGNVGAIS
jgi:hypothetical protein